jgi:hypothetical protein
MMGSGKAGIFSGTRKVIKQDSGSQLITSPPRPVRIRAKRLVLREEQDLAE